MNGRVKSLRHPALCLGENVIALSQHDDTLRGCARQPVNITEYFISMLVQNVIGQGTESRNYKYPGIHKDTVPAQHEHLAYTAHVHICTTRTQTAAQPSWLHGATMACSGYCRCRRCSEKLRWAWWVGARYYGHTVVDGHCHAIRCPPCCGGRVKRCIHVVHSVSPYQGAIGLDLNLMSDKKRRCGGEMAEERIKYRERRNEITLSGLRHNVEIEHHNCKTVVIERNLHQENLQKVGPHPSRQVERQVGPLGGCTALQPVTER